MKYIGSCPSTDRLVICSEKARFAPSIFFLRENDNVYIPCGTWIHYHKELEKARRGKGTKTKWYDDGGVYRLVELSKASLIMYLKQQESILTSVIKSTELISEYTVTSINGDSKKSYMCYRDAHRIFFLSEDDLYSNRKHIHRVLSVLGISYDDIMAILEIDTDEINVNENNIDLLVGKHLASDVYYTWPEEFVDEDTGDLVTIMMSKILYYCCDYLDEEIVKDLIEHKIPTVTVVHDIHSRDKEYLDIFHFYTDQNLDNLSPAIKNDILKMFFPHKRPSSITNEEKSIMAYNLVMFIKAIKEYYYVENPIFPFRTFNDDLHNEVTLEEEKLSLLISEYYQQMIDNVKSCESEIDVMPLFPETQSYQKLKGFLLSRNVNETFVDKLLSPIISIIHFE